MSVTVAVFFNVPEARVVKAFLESHLIPCFLADENILSVHPFMAAAVGGTKLTVQAAHEAEVRRLYEEFRAGQHESSVEEIPDCPACGSDGVLPLPALPGVYYNEFRCFDCDHEWDDRARHNLNPGHIE